MNSLLPSLLVTFKYKYNIVNYSQHAVHCIPMTYLFYNWNLCLFTPFTQFFPPPKPSLWHPPIYFCLFIYFGHIKWHVEFPQPGMSLCLLPWKWGLLTTGPTGKTSHWLDFFFCFCYAQSLLRLFLAPYRLCLAAVQGLLIPVASLVEDHGL